MTDRNRDLDEIRQRLGLAPLGLTGQVRPGAVFIVDMVTTEKEAIINFPERELKETRTERESRRVIVAQSLPLCVKDSLKSVLVIPTSASHPHDRQPVRSWEFEIPSSEPAFDKDRPVAYPALVQPVLKSRLVRCAGVLSAESLGEVEARLEMLFGTFSSGSAPSLPLPPR